MAFVVKTKPNRFEIRESRTTPEGPRSRTLVSFRELTDEVIDRAQQRASKPLSEDQLRSAALRAGAVVPGRKVDEAARETLRRLARGERPDPMLRQLLLDALERGDRSDRPRDMASTVSDSARSASEWIGAGARERAGALIDLLELTDALPLRPRPLEIDFPRLKSA